MAPTGRRPRQGLFGLVALVVVAIAAMQLYGAWSRDRLGAQVGAAARPGDIRMIGSTTCVYCARAREWFEANRVPFTECQIERDAACADQYRALLAPGTPVMIVRGQRLLGFDARAIAQALSGDTRVQ